MTIRADAEALLKVLVAMSDREDGDGDPRARAVHEESFKAWSIARFNVAIQLLVKEGCIEDEDVGGSHPYDMDRLCVTLDGRMAAERLASRPDIAAVDALNRGARRLLMCLHGSHLEVGGVPFSLSYGPKTAEATGLTYEEYRAAAQRLVERGLAGWAGQAALKTTAEGIWAAEDAATLARYLPLSDDESGSRSKGADVTEVHEANRRARRLLAYLHEWSMKGPAFQIGPNEETFGATGLTEEEYRRAADRLIRKSFARHMGGGYGITVTDEGVRVAEDADALDFNLPLGNDRDEGKVVAVAADNRKVFVIHGRNLEARKQMGIYLRALGLEPINFDDLRAGLGGTPTIADIVMAGMQQAQGVVALFTADEYAALKPELRGSETGEAVERWQSRPNVLFEAGIAFGIDRNRVVIVKLGRVSLPSDFGGIHALGPTNDVSGHRNTLRNTLKGMGCAVGDGSDWMKDGDFEAAASVGLSGVSPKDPFRP